MIKQTKPGLTAMNLRYLALFFMLLDHIWFALVGPEQFWLTCVGRLALPIFAFQIAEGYVHTSHFWRYAGRLLVFGLISEVPFDLMVGGRLFYPGLCNVMFTLLLGLLILKTADWASKQGLLGKIAGALLAIGLYLLADILGTDYGGRGVLMVLLFGLTGKIETDPRMPRHLGKIIQLAGLTAISWLIGGRVWAGMSMQSLAVLSLIVIWLYRGQKGTGGRLAQYGAYAFYPAHMLLLAVLRQVL